MAAAAKSMPLDSLFTLVRTLTAVQRREFRRYTNQYGGEDEQRYAMLVQLVCRYVDTKESELSVMEFVQRHGNLGSKATINALARYAFERLLDSVRTRPEISFRLNKLLQLLQDINFLFYKGLYHECHDLVERALVLARELNRPTLVLEVLQWNRRLYQILYKFDQIAAYWEQLEQETRAVLQQLRDETEYSLLSNQLFAQIYRNKRLPRELADAVNVKLFAVDGDFLRAASPMTRIWYLNSQHNYYELQYRLMGHEAKGPGGQSYLELRQSCHRQILELFHHENHVQREEDPHVYNLFLENYLATTLALGRFEEFDRLEAEFQAKQHEMSYVRAVAFHRLRYMVARAEFEEACAYLEQIDLFERIGRLQGNISDQRLISLYFTGGQAFFLAGKFTQAQMWFSELYHLPRSKSLEMLQTLGEIFLLLAQYECGPARILPMLQTLSNRVRRHKIAEAILLPLLDAIRLVVRRETVGVPAKGRVSRLPTIIDETYAAITQQKQLLIFGNLLAWVEAKRNGTTITEEIKKYTALAQS